MQSAQLYSGRILPIVIVLCGWIVSVEWEFLVSTFECTDEPHAKDHRKSFILASLRSFHVKRDRSTCRS